MVGGIEGNSRRTEENQQGTKAAARNYSNALLPLYGLL